MKNSKKVFLQSLGCPKNLVDSEIMLGSLTQKGYELTHDESQADLIIVNTCGFLQASAQESVNTLLKLAEQKKSGNCKKLIATGCLSERYQGAGGISQELPEVDLFVGTNDYAKIAELADLPDREYIHPPLYIHNENTPRLRATPKHWAYVKISEGCNHTCTFCIIPQLRGKQRSRSIDSIIAEMQQLHSEGVREFNLIAQDSTDYGGDLHDGTTIEKLLAAISRKLPLGIWCRLMYAYPLRFSDELVERLADSDHFARYLDIPFQHISDPVLKSMRRGSNGNYIRDIITRLRKKIPGMGIRTTLITGYPGETEDDFKRLYEFVTEAGLARVGVFAFSNEPGTPANELPDQVPQPMREERRDRIMELQQRISLKRNQSLVGKIVTVLVEQTGWGRSEWDAPEIDGKVILTGQNLIPGEFRRAKITKALPYDLEAHMVEK